MSLTLGVAGCYWLWLVLENRALPSCLLSDVEYLRIFGVLQLKRLLVPTCECFVLKRTACSEIVDRKVEPTFQSMLGLQRGVLAPG